MVVERLFFGILRKAVACFTRLSEVLCMYMGGTYRRYLRYLGSCSRTHLHHDPAATVGGAPPLMRLPPIHIPRYIHSYSRLCVSLALLGAGGAAAAGAGAAITAADSRSWPL